ncbi:MAG: MBL fold metallo-hydrolase [Thermoplasmata archaeon]|nr:MBL fold metallo-hydrolase [Thermoplasmata archaeon]
MKGIRFTALDGSGTIGGSKLLLEYDGHSLLLDFGINYHAMDDYYEEYLQPRTPCGILDYVTMGVLPMVSGLYREDLLHPNASLENFSVGRIDAILVSHAHMDHCGHLGFLPRNMPMASSKMTAAIMKAIEDISPSKLGRDCIFLKERAAGETERGDTVIKTTKGPSRGRDFYATDGGITKSFGDFWNLRPATQFTKKNNSMQPGEFLEDLHDIDIDSYPVDHSIKGANAFIIHTSQGSVTYTGDIRLHGLHGDDTLEFVEQAKRANTYALIIEGTNIDGESKSASEREVKENSEKILDDAKDDFVIVDFGPRNIERMEIFLEIAEKYHRKLVVTSKDAYLLAAMNTADTTTPDPNKRNILIYDCPRGKYDYWEKYIFNQKYPDLSIKPFDIMKSPGSYLLSFSFFDMSHLVDLRPENGQYIYSSSEAHSEEQVIDFKRLNNWLKRFDIKPHGFSVDKEGKVKSEKGLHASGHASKDDITDIIRKIDPEILMPVHTVRPEWFADSFSGERDVKLPKQCEPIDL